MQNLLREFRLSATILALGLSFPAMAVEQCPTCAERPAPGVVPPLAPAQHGVNVVQPPADPTTVVAPQPMRIPLKDETGTTRGFLVHQPSTNETTIEFTDPAGAVTGSVRLMTGATMQMYSYNSDLTLLSHEIAQIRSAITALQAQVNAQAHR